MYLSMHCTVLAPSRSHTSHVLCKYTIIHLSNTSRSRTSGVLVISITSATPTDPHQAHEQVRGPCPRSFAPLAGSHMGGERESRRTPAGVCRGQRWGGVCSRAALLFCPTPPPPFARLVCAQSRGGANWARGRRGRRDVPWRRCMQSPPLPGLRTTVYPPV